MTRTILYILTAILVSLCVALPIPRDVRAQASKPLLVIVANAAGITDISGALLRRAFGGYAAEYQPGKRLLPLNHPTGTLERQRFDRAVLGLGPDEVGRFWVDQRIRGTSQPPRTVPSAELAVRVVASFPGAITYTTPEQLKPGLIVLTIDGRAPSDRNYLLAAP